MKLYFAYGANTNRENAEERCPDMNFVGRGTLRGWRLEFHGVADIAECPNETLEGTLAFISDDDERALDRFEGYPMLYIKRYVKVRSDEGWEATAMVYVMRNPGRRAMPSKFYEDCLRVGYAEFGLNARQIDAAITRASESTRVHLSKRWGSRALDDWYEELDDGAPHASWDEYDAFLEENI